jgi:hypothetical protein
MPQNPYPIDLALETPGLSYDNSAKQMLYRERLKHWAVVRLLPDMQRRVMARFRSRADADGHLRFLRRNAPDSDFVVVFDPQ